MKLQPARGTKDIWGEDQQLHHYVVEVARQVSSRYGFQELSTPIFEFTEIFKRTLGDTSDVVTKEMYCFEDRGGESMTLRPEFTAGVVRAFISGGMAQQVPCKFFSTGPLFRYERPQKGRYRQFHQINMEYIGVASFQADIEVISLAWLILYHLGLSDAVTLELNSLGDVESRQQYRNALVEYFTRYKNDLSEDSQVRLKKNPMRILDSKDEGDKELVKNAPVIGEFYSSEARAFFDGVQQGLSQLGIGFTLNPRLVRGLDYYCHTAFEFTTDQLGAQNAVLAGGRYDGLIKQMGGPDTPAIGFAGGVERLMALTSQRPKSIRPIAIIPIGNVAEEEANSLAFTLRKEGFAIELSYSGNVGKRMKKADKANAIAALFMGEEESAKGVVKVRDLDSGKEQEVVAASLLDHLAHYK